MSCNKVNILYFNIAKQNQLVDGKETREKGCYIFFLTFI